MGQTLKRPIKMYNIEARAHKAVDKAKTVPKAAPRYPTVVSLLFILLGLVSAIHIFLDHKAMRNNLRRLSAHMPLTVILAQVTTTQLHHSLCCLSH